MSGNLDDYELGEVIAVQGKADCQDPRCSHVDGRCRGYHCPKCGGPCSMMGHVHGCPTDKED